ncbi:hypothetical protein EDD16DRAFT_1524578 [Pisolithus croceorrhizus]|nr:hypothetical protein EDD16DRAFT_1524578 [Pisolithus croceorrhizus]
MAQLAVQDTSKASQAAEQAQQQSEAVWQNQIRTHCYEDELIHKAEETKRMEQNIQAECNTSQGQAFGESPERNRQAQEKVSNAQQASKEIAKKARTAQVAAEQEEVEECLKRGIQRVIIPVLDKVATMKTRVQFEQGVVGSGKSWLIEIRVKDGVVFEGMHDDHMGDCRVPM